MSNSVEKVNSYLQIKLGDFRNGGITQEQCLTDFAVILMSNMRLPEIENALYMSLGVEGVAELISKRFQDKELNNVATMAKEDSE